MMEDNKKDDLNVEEIKLEISDDDEDGNNNVVYACEKCPATYESKKKLNQHTKRVHDEKKLSVPLVALRSLAVTIFTKKA